MRVAILSLVLILVIGLILSQILKSKRQNSHKKIQNPKRVIPAHSFKGKKEGYVFKTENGLTGYYVDDFYSCNRRL